MKLIKYPCGKDALGDTEFYPLAQSIQSAVTEYRKDGPIGLYAQDKDWDNPQTGLPYDAEPVQLVSEEALASLEVKHEG